MKTILYYIALSILISGCTHHVEQPCDDHYIKGTNYALVGNLEDADKEFDLAIRQDAKNANAWYGKGTICHLRNKENEAVEYFDKAISLNPQLALAYYERGACHKIIGQTDKALKDMHEADRLLPNANVIKIIEASYMTDYSHHQDAISLLTQVIDADPSNSMALSFRANYFHSSGQVDAAIKDYKQVLNIIGPQGTICYYLSTLYYEKGDYQRALENLNEARRLRVDFPGLLRKKGLYEHYLLKDAEACNDFNAAAAEGDTVAKLYIKKFCPSN